jgi:signal transduction histidine kinase
VVDEPRDPVIYRADEAQIKQIVWNLATNGLRAMTAGGELRLAVRAMPTEVVVGVSDQGVGIAPADMDGIFQPFRGGFARGTGLGLSIVHRIASDYGGEVRVTSEQGKGTTVQVALPLATATSPLALADDRKGVV